MMRAEGGNQHQELVNPRLEGHSGKRCRNVIEYGQFRPRGAACQVLLQTSCLISSFHGKPGIETVLSLASHRPVGRIEGGSRGTRLLCPGWVSESILGTRKKK